MSTHNATLHNTVVAILQNQEQELKKSKAQLAAATFTLHYAQGAAINTCEKLQAAQKNTAAKKLVKDETENVASQSTNMLQSANSANTYVKQCVTNTAVSAANIQIAANAILKLASDVGTVFNIINVADFGSDLYNLAKELYSNINTTAYHAQLASQLGMETTMLTSKVTASTLTNKAKSTNDAMNILLKDVSDNYMNTVQLITEDNSACSNTLATEKIAAGTYENMNVQCNAANDSYHSLNNELNLGLNAYAIESTEATNFGVTFRTISPPFEEKTEEQHYTVKDYYLFVVKENRKPFFTIEVAQDILVNGAKQYIPLSNLMKQNNIAATGKKIVVDFNYTKMVATDSTTFIQEDTDGDIIKHGVNYVVFLLAVFYEDYKKKLNNFDDFLSAPSPSFSLIQALAAVNGTTIIAERNNDSNCNITFTVTEHPNYDVVYKCMLLPDIKESIKGLLNNSNASDVDTEVNELRNIATKYDPKIAKFEATLIEAEVLIDDLKKRNQISDEDAAKLKEQLHHAEMLQQQLNKLIAEKNNAIKLININHTSKINFFFNQLIAEQVPVANYTTAVKSITPPNEAADVSVDTNTSPIVKWKASLNAATTDIFGNKLIKDKSYIPVVLSISSVEEENISKFTNAWSGYENTNSFKY